MSRGPSPEPNRWPTAKEWVDWFLEQDRERQIEVASRAIEDAQIASDCFLLDHRGRLSAHVPHVVDVPLLDDEDASQL